MLQYINALVISKFVVIRTTQRKKKASKLTDADSAEAFTYKALAEGNGGMGGVSK